jgi:hypothetical protein
MSQHIWNSENTEVRMGYDRPLDMIFCTVSIRGEIAYTNLDDEEAGTECQDVEYYRGVLLGLRITVPEEMYAEVKYDQANRTGNRVVEYKS